MSKKKIESTVLHIPKGAFALAGIIDPKAPTATMSGVLVRRNSAGRMSVASTNGRVGLLLEWNGEHLSDAMGGEARYIVPGDVASMVEKALPKKGEPDEMVAVMTVEDGDPMKVRVSRPLEAITFEGGAIEGEYPDIDGVIPKYETVVPDEGASASVATLGIDLLIEMLQSIRGSGVDDVTVAVPLKQGRALVFSGTSIHGGTLSAVIMPRYSSKPVDDEQPTEENNLPGMEEQTEEKTQTETLAEVAKATGAFDGLSGVSIQVNDDKPVAIPDPLDEAHAAARAYAKENHLNGAELCRLITTAHQSCKTRKKPFVAAEVIAAMQNRVGVFADIA
jgi:hypothetical protein